MPARYSLDINVFVYCFDRRDRRKQARAEGLVGQALLSSSQLRLKRDAAHFIRKIYRTVRPSAT